MSKTLNTKEAMQALLDGKKLKVSFLSKKEYIYLNEEGDVVTTRGMIYCLGSDQGLYVYEEPKQKKRVWQVAVKTKFGTAYIVMSELLDEDQIKYIEAHGDVIIKIAGPFEVSEE